MATDLEQFQQLLNTFLSPDNDVRTKAEEAYSNLPLESKVTFLLSSVCNDTWTKEIRSIAAVLLRRLFSSEFMDFYAKIPIEAQSQLKENILFCVKNEQDESMRRKVCEVAAEFARNLIDEGGQNLWPEFLEFLYNCVNGPVTALKENALRIFTSVPGIFGNKQKEHLSHIKRMLHQSVIATTYEVRFQAVRAIGAFIILHDKETTIQKQFSELLQPILRVITESVQNQDDDALLKVLIDLAEHTPKFLRPELENIMEICMNIFSTEGIDDSWRQLGLEVLVTLSETAPAMVRKVGGKYIVSLVPLVLKMMTDLDEDEKWSFSDEIIEDDNDSNNVVAESALDRLACGLGGQTMLPQIVQNIPTMLSNPDWKYRHAALMAISAVGEGCHKQMETMLSDIMDGVIQYLQDPHPRVRYAACNAVGQMSTDFAPIFEKKFHEKVIPGLLMVLNDNANPRVQAHAGAALVNFSEDCPKSILTPYLDAIMSKLEFILTAKVQELAEKGTKLVLEQVVTTIASVADTCEEQFIAYYDRLMPCLKYIIENANRPEHKLLRGKTIECVSLIGLAVGSEKFISDANEVMDMLLKTHPKADLPDDDPQTSYLISAWARICKILGKQFEQYLPLVMGPVLKAAAMKPEVALLDNEDMEDVEGDLDWQFVSLGEQQNFGIKTAGLEEKASACEMLVCYARELKEGFADYAEEVVKLMVPMLKFYFHDGVRTAAAISLPFLLDCAKIKGPQYLEDMWNYICPELLKAMDSEPESEVLLELLFSLAKCIETLGAGCLQPQFMAELLRILNKLLTEHFEKAVARSEKRKDEDYDEVVEEQLADEDNEDVYTLSKIADILHALFITHKSSFFPFFDQICGHFVKLLSPERTWSDHQWALCVFDDVIEYGGPECVNYQELFLQPMIQYVNDESAEVRQAAAYGCGVLGQFGGEAFARACAEALPRLMKVISEPDSRTPEKVNPTENAISAVTKILKYNNSAINVDEILPHWLRWLPVVEDEDEAPHVYGYLCDLIEANHMIILGPNNSNIPSLIKFFAEALHREVVPTDNPVMVRIIGIIRQIQSNDSLFEACINALTPDQHRVLYESLSAQPGKLSHMLST